MKSCQSEYEAASDGSGLTMNSPQTTSIPTKNPTKSPQSQSAEPTVSPSHQNTALSPTHSPTSEPTAAEATSSMSPSLNPITSAPTKLTANYCGVSWSIHSEDCENARPCPRGDECETGETCFSDSPCAAMISGNPALESNIVHLCGTSWNKLVNDCEDATPCPKGDECQTGEICYRNFECNPPESLASKEELAGAFQPSVNTTMEVIVNGQDMLSNDSSKTSDDNAPLDVSTTESETPSASLTDTANGDTSISSSDTSVDVSEKSQPQIVPSKLEHCNICGAAGEFDYNSNVDFDVPDGVINMACGELIWMFAKNNVYDGSSECLAARARYFDDCCYSTPQNSCNICPDGMEYYTDKTTLFMGSETACSRVQAHFSSRYEMPSDECKDGITDHSYDCCFRKCTICGDSLPNWEVTVDFSGEDLKCNEFDIMFREENEKHDSSRCRMAQDLYSDECCMPPLETPCDICQTQKSGMNLKSEETVSYEAALTTCLVVYTHMFSNVEDGSDKCTRAQKDLADQCCGILESDPASTSYDRAPAPVEENLNTPTPAPAPTEDVLSSQWYAGSLNRPSSSASAVRPLLGLVIFVVVLM